MDAHVTAWRNSLVVEQHKMPEKVVSTMLRKGKLIIPDAPKAVDEGIEALIKASRDYNPSTGFKFITLAMTYVKNAIYRFLEKEIVRKKREYKCHNEFVLREQHKYKATPQYLFNDEDVHKALRCLHELDRKAIMLVYGEGFSYPVAAQVMGVSPQRVKQRTLSAINKLRVRLGLKVHKKRIKKRGLSTKRASGQDLQQNFGNL